MEARVRAACCWIISSKRLGAIGCSSAPKAAAAALKAASASARAAPPPLGLSGPAKFAGAKIDRLPYMLPLNGGFLLVAVGAVCEAARPSAAPASTAAAAQRRTIEMSTKLIAVGANLEACWPFACLFAC